MVKGGISIAAALMGALAWMAFPAHADITLEVDSYTGSELEARMVIHFREDSVRLDLGKEQSSTIIDLNANLVLVIDHGEKSYAQFSLNVWKTMPGVQQPLPEKLALKVKKTGERKLINGFPTSKVEIYDQDRLVEELWVTQDSRFAELERIAKRWERKFQESFLGKIAGGRELALDIGGFPVMTVSHGGPGGVVTRSEVKRVSVGKLPDHMFGPPKGYSQLSLGPQGPSVPSGDDD